MPLGPGAGVGVGVGAGGSAGVRPPPIGRLTNLATEGVPFVDTRKSM